MIQMQIINIKANVVFLIDEFLSQEIRNGNVTADQFTKENHKILLHGHCHQKALSSVNDSAWILGLPENYEVEVIPSGCCGMAGSFGYEKEHYDVSMKIGELVLFPAIRKSANEAIIAAPGTSCRHQRPFPARICPDRIRHPGISRLNQTPPGRWDCC